MRVDLGFWNQQGEYIQDIQEINKMDIDKYFEELNDMANFKGFGEKPETEDEEIMIERLQQENAKLKAENERLKENDCEQCKHLDLYIEHKQILQEVKGILEEYCDECFEIDGHNKPDDCKICPYTKILKSIREVG